MLAAGLGEGLVGSLHDALRADIDPRAGGHLAVHRQPLAIELVEMVPGRPVRNQVGIGDQHPRRIGMGPEHADRLARLHQKRLVVFERLQGRDDEVEILPGARGAADAAIDHQLVRVLGDVRVQVVHQHAHRRFGQPALGRDLRAGRREDVATVLPRVAHSGLQCAMNARISREDAAQARGLVGLVGPRRRFQHVGRLRQLHLDGVDVVVRAAVVARGPAALEAAVDDMAVAPCRRADGAHAFGQALCAAPAAVVADIEVGQPAFEKEGNGAADRMAVVKHGMAVERLDPLDLAPEGGVIGGMIKRNAAGDLFGCRVPDRANRSGGRRNR